VTARLWPLLALALGGAGCVGQGGLPACVPDGCEQGQQCIVGRCRPSGSVPARPTSRRVLVEPADLAVLHQHESDAGSDTIALGGAAHGDVVVLLAYDVELKPDDEVEGAFIVLHPAEDALPAEGLIPLEVASVRSPWKSASASWGRRPKLSLPTDAGFARARPPAVLRVDVTHLVRDWPAQPRSVYGIALLAESTEPVGATYARGTTGGHPPRLEVYLK
jgi:hypothetical protein